MTIKMTNIETKTEEKNHLSPKNQSLLLVAILLTTGAEKVVAESVPTKEVKKLNLSACQNLKAAAAETDKFLRKTSLLIFSQKRKFLNHHETPATTKRRAS
jgi:hypothetical protein